MSSTMYNPQARFVNLDHDQLLVLSDRRGDRVEVLFGGIWLTEENSRNDRFIEAGDGWQIEKQGRVVAEAIGRTGVRISAPPRAIAEHGRALLGRLKQLRPTLAARGLATVLALVLSVGLAELTTRGFQGQAGQTHAVIASHGIGLSDPV